MDNEKRHRDRDTGVRHIKRGPGISISNVQIEKEKIDHVPVQEAIGQIPQNPCEQQRKREIAKSIRRSRSDEQSRHDRQRDDGDYNEESIVAPEGSKRRTGIRDVNQTEEIRHDNARIIRTDETQDHLLRELVQRVERKREEDDEFHVAIDRANVQRPTSNVQRLKQNVARLNIER